MAGTEALAPEQDVAEEFVFDESQLIPEWRRVVAELRQTSRGNRQLRRQDFQRYIVDNSAEIEDLTQAALAVNGSEAATARRVAELYAAVPGLIDFSGRIAILGAGRTQSLIGGVSFKQWSGNEQRQLKKRKHATMLEELSRVSSNGHAEAFAKRAMDLNLDVRDSKKLDVWTSPRKFHATFSIYGIGWRSFFLEPSIIKEHQDVKDLPLEARLDLALAIQRDSHKKLGEIVSAGRAHPKAEDSAVMGSIGERLVVGRFNDRLIQSGNLSVLEMADGSIRQDRTRREINGGKSYTEMPRLSFDLFAKNHITGRELPIEVKKLSVGSRVTGNPMKYVEGITVVSFRLGNSSADFLRITEDYCSGRIAEIDGNQPTSKEEEALAEVRTKIDKELDGKVYPRLLAS